MCPRIESNLFKSILLCFILFNIVSVSSSSSPVILKNPQQNEKDKAPGFRELFSGTSLDGGISSTLSNMFGGWTTWLSAVRVGLILWAAAFVGLGIIWMIWYFFFYGTSGGLYGWNYAGGGNKNGGYPIPIPRPPYSQRSLTDENLFDMSQLILKVLETFNIN